MQNREQSSFLELPKCSLPYKKVQSVTEGGATAGATALVKEKPSSYVGAQDKGL